MARSLLLVTHGLIVVLLVAAIVINPAEAAPVLIVPLALAGLILRGLFLRRRWVIAPATLMLAGATMITAFMTIGNIAWPERTINRVFLGYGLFAAAEVAVIIVAIAQFPKSSGPA